MRRIFAVAGIGFTALAASSPAQAAFHPLGRHRRLPGLGPEHSDQAGPLELQDHQQAGPDTCRRAGGEGRHAQEGCLQAVKREAVP